MSNPQHLPIKGTCWKVFGKNRKFVSDQLIGDTFPSYGDICELRYRELRYLVLWYNADELRISYFKQFMLTYTLKTVTDVYLH